MIFKNYKISHKIKINITWAVCIIDAVGTAAGSCSLCATGLDVVVVVVGELIFEVDIDVKATTG